MEVKKFMDAYRKHSPKQFYEWISRGLTMELRFLSNYKGEKFKNWNLIKTVAAELNLEYRYNSIYINSYEQCKAVLLYKIKNIPLTRFYNIFIGVNPRRKVFVANKNGLLIKSYYGGIAGTSHIQNILCDIEHRGIRADNATEKMLDECIDGALHLVKLLNLKTYAINISGNGTHLWFPLEDPILLPVPSFKEIEIKGRNKVKYNLKEEPIRTWIKTYNRFIETLDGYLQSYNPLLKVDDGAKDLSRIARFPGSWNVKQGKQHRCVGTVIFENKLINNINTKFTSVYTIRNKSNETIIKTAERSRNYRYNLSNIRDCPLVKLLLSNMLPSILSRNHYLEQSLARILKDNNIKVDDVQDLINEIDEVQGKSIQIDPDYLEGDEVFNSETINTYCIASKIDLVYPILEDIPEISNDYDYVDDARYMKLNNYSAITINASRIQSINKLPKDYIHLKNEIRRLVDAGFSRSEIFFTMKFLYKDEWEYYDNNRIIQSLLNKTRRRLE